MRGKICITTTVFLTLILLLGIPLADAMKKPLITNNTKINSSEPLNGGIRFQINDTLPPRPLLSIEKSINNTEVQPEKEWIRINITIKNIGNRTAYNLTVTDPIFSNWAVSSLNITEQDYVQVDINATVFYFYYFKTIIEGNFTLEATEITYYNFTGVEYHAKSQRFNIISIEIINLPVIRAELWVKILYYCIGISLGLGLIVLVDYAYVKQLFQRTRRKIQPAKKTSVQQMSKKQMKKKVKKRRK